MNEYFLGNIIDLFIKIIVLSSQFISKEKENCFCDIIIIFVKRVYKKFYNLFQTFFVSFFNYKYKKKQFPE